MSVVTIEVLEPQEIQEEAPETKPAGVRLRGKAARAERMLALGQGAAYVAAGLWPLLNLRSFAKATGPKPEGWLVKAVGALLVTIGSTLLLGGRSGERRSTELLGAGTGLALGSIALFYSLKRRISPVYFLDAAQHLGWTTAWAIARIGRTLEERRLAAENA